MTRMSKITIVAASVVVALVVTFTFNRARRPGSGDAVLWIRSVLGMRTSRLPVCRDNLIRIQLAKDMWANERFQTSPVPPTWTDLQDDFPDWVTNNARRWTNGRPFCPSGGTVFDALIPRHYGFTCFAAASAIFTADDASFIACASSAAFHELPSNCLYTRRFGSSTTVRRLC